MKPAALIESTKTRKKLWSFARFFRRGKLNKPNKPDFISGQLVKHRRAHRACVLEHGSCLDDPHSYLHIVSGVERGMIHT
jgi:hypothetical protein